MRVEPTQNFHCGRFGWVRAEERLAQWGFRQHRQVTTAQLRAVGWDDSLVAKRVKAGRLHPVFAEVYSLGGPPRTDRERWMASVLTFGEGTRLSDSAAVELFGWHVDQVPVTSPEQTILDCAATIRNDRIIRQAQAEQATNHVRLLLLCARSVGVRGVARPRRPDPHQPRHRRQ